MYRQPGVHHPQSFDLYSLGADGRSESGGNDADDIASWHRPVRWRYHYVDSFRFSVHAGLLGMIVGLAFAVWFLRRWRKRTHA